MGRRRWRRRCIPGGGDEQRGVTSETRAVTAIHNNNPSLSLTHHQSPTTTLSRPAASLTPQLFMGLIRYVYRPSTSDWCLPIRFTLTYINRETPITILALYLHPFSVLNEKYKKLEKTSNCKFVYRSISDKLYFVWYFIFSYSTLDIKLQE